MRRMTAVLRILRHFPVSHLGFGLANLSLYKRSCCRSWGSLRLGSDASIRIEVVRTVTRFGGSATHHLMHFSTQLLRSLLELRNGRLKKPQIQFVAPNLLIYLTLLEHLMLRTRLPRVLPKHSNTKAANQFSERMAFLYSTRAMQGHSALTKHRATNS